MCVVVWDFGKLLQAPVTDLLTADSGLVAPETPEASLKWSNREMRRGDHSSYSLSTSLSTSIFLQGNKCHCYGCLPPVCTLTWGPSFAQIMGESHWMVESRQKRGTASTGSLDLGWNQKPVMRASETCAVSLFLGPNILNKEPKAVIESQGPLKVEPEKNNTNMRRRTFRLWCKNCWQVTSSAVKLPHFEPYEYFKGFWPSVFSCLIHVILHYKYQLPELTFGSHDQEGLISHGPEAQCSVAPTIFNLYGGTPRHKHWLNTILMINEKKTLQFFCCSAYGD